MLSKLNKHKCYLEAVFRRSHFWFIVTFDDFFSLDQDAVDKT